MDTSILLRRSISIFVLVITILALAACGGKATLPATSQPANESSAKDTSAQPAAEKADTQPPEPTKANTPTQPPAPSATTAPTKAPATPTPGQNLSELLASQTQVQKFYKDLTESEAGVIIGFPQVLSGKLTTAYTILAPVDETYQPMAVGKPVDPKITDFLMYHAVKGIYRYEDLLKMDGQSLPTFREGLDIKVTVKDGVVYLNDSATIVTPDLEASNGVVHLISTALQVPDK